MKIFHTKKIYNTIMQKICIILFCIINVVFVAQTAFGAETNTSDNVTSGLSGLSEDKTVIFREPMLPGENSIDVSRENNSIGIMSDYITMVYKYVLALGSIIAVLVIMFGGIQIMISGGDGDAQGQAKEMIFKTLTGIALLFLAGLFLYAINPNFYVFDGDSSLSTNSSSGGSSSPSVFEEGEANGLF